MEWAAEFETVAEELNFFSVGFRTLLAVLSAILMMIAGYFAAGSLLYGSIVTGAAQLPGLSIEGLIGILLFYAIAAPLERSGLLKRLASRAVR